MQNCTNDIDQCVNGKIEIETAWKTEKIFIFKWIGIIERAHGFRHRWAKIENAFGKCAVRAQHLVMCQPATNERIVWLPGWALLLHGTCEAACAFVQCIQEQTTNEVRLCARNSRLTTSYEYFWFVIRLSSISILITHFSECILWSICRCISASWSKLSFDLFLCNFVTLAKLAKAHTRKINVCACPKQCKIESLWFIRPFVFVCLFVWMCALLYHNCICHRQAIDNCTKSKIEKVIEWQW